MANRLTDQQIAQASYNAGLRGEALVKSVAIALAESGGDASQIFSPNTDSSLSWYNRWLQAVQNNLEFSVGLWQINVGGSLAERLINWGLASFTNLQDPMTNAWAMNKISKGGTDWTPWSTYNHGTYLQFMGRAATASAAVDTSGGGISLEPVKNIQLAQQILYWWNSNPFSHNALSTWQGVVNELSATNKPAGDYLLSILKFLDIPLDVPLGPADSVTGSAPVVIGYLENVAGVSSQGDIIGGAINSVISPFLEPIAHAFYFVIFIIIGLVVLVVGFKTSRTGREGEYA